MKKNIRGQLKKRLLNGETVIGPFVIIPSMSLVETLGYAGMDFCILDTEHGPLSIQTVNELVISAQGADIAPIVRIPNNEESLILRALDIGADGVQVPQINTILDAKRVVESAKYSPLGHRGVSIFTRAGNYYKDEATNHTNIQNEETMTVVHIEGKEGLDNLNEIMTIDGIDVLFLGPYDISQSLGVPGDVRSKIVENALKKAAEEARSQGRVVGSYAKDVEMGKWLIDLGVQYLSINVDATIYMQACENIVSKLK
ncbi:MAG: HpcH/HpaI aldolase family protein [Dehalococcoidia bacterium]